jgi:SAM-dependent methyltransferase
VVVVKERLLLEGETFSVVRCQGCGLLRTDPRPTKSEHSRYYPAHYGPYQPAEVAAQPWLRPGLKGLIRRWTLTTHYSYRLAHLGGVRARVIGAVTRPLKGRYVTFPPFRPGGRLVEVGCATGGRLCLLQSLGWEVRGVEINERACQVARTRYGLDVFCGELWEAGLPDASVDAVVMSHVIEHLPDPVRTLREVRRILRPRGVLIMETPNAGGLERRLFGPWWFSWETPRHLFLFDVRTLSVCCAMAGLRVRSLAYSSSVAAWTRSLAYWLEDRRPAGAAAWWKPLLRREAVWGRVLKPLGLLLALAGLSGRLIAVAEASDG